MLGNDVMKKVSEAGLGLLLYDVFDLSGKADDKHIAKEVKFRSKKYHEGYQDALEAIKNRIVLRATTTRGEINE